MALIALFTGVFTVNKMVFATVTILSKSPKNESLDFSVSGLGDFGGEISTCVQF